MARLVLDRDHLSQMLRAPDFYEAVPEFAYLEESANAAHQMYLDKMAECPRCEKSYQYMRGVCDAFFIKVKQAEPAVLDKIKDWLSKRKGYVVSTVVLYYRNKAQGRIRPFNF